MNCEKYLIHLKIAVLKNYIFLVINFSLFGAEFNFKSQKKIILNSTDENCVKFIQPE